MALKRRSLGSNIRYFRKYLLDSSYTEADWSRGMVRDVPFSSIPAGGSYQLTDFFVDKGGLLYKRGGTAYQGSTLNAHSDVDIIAVACPDYITSGVSDPRVCAFTSDSTNTWLYDVTSAATSVGNVGFSPFENPKIYNATDLIITDGLNAARPKKAFISGGNVTLAALGGRPPIASLSCIHAGRLVLASGQTLYFGPALGDESDVTKAISAVSTGSKTFTIPGNLTDTFISGYRFSIWGSTGNDSRYTTVSSVISSTNTVITVSESVSSAVADGSLGGGWDTDEGFIAVGQHIMGLASVQGVLVVFSRTSCFRVTGSVPPGYGVDVTLVDMQLQPLGDVGCIDARTIVGINNDIYFANESGVFSTNGAGFVNLTNKDDGTGISSLWQSTLQSFSPALGAVVAAGTYLEQFYIVSVLHNSGTRTQFIYYLTNKSWVQTSVKTGVTMYASRTAPTVKLYGGPSESGALVRLLDLSGMWSPASGNKNDADGTAVTPTWTSRMYAEGRGLNRYGFGHLTYDMRDAASDNPTLAVQISTGFEQDSGFAATVESPIAETTKAIRKRFTVNKDTQGLGIKLTQTHASSKTEIYYLDGEVAGYFIADGQ